MRMKSSPTKWTLMLTLSLSLAVLLIAASGSVGCGGDGNGRDAGVDVREDARADAQPDAPPADAPVDVPADVTGDAPPADMTADAPPGDMTPTGDGACNPCSAILPPTNASPTTVCPGKSATLAAELQACTCEGACAADCGDNRCTGAKPSSECAACVIGSGCTAEYQACAADQ